MLFANSFATFYSFEKNLKVMFLCLNDYKV